MNLFRSYNNSSRQTTARSTDDMFAYFREAQFRRYVCFFMKIFDFKGHNLLKNHRLPLLLSAVFMCDFTSTSQILTLFILNGLNFQLYLVYVCSRFLCQDLCLVLRTRFLPLKCSKTQLFANNVLWPEYENRLAKFKSIFTNRQRRNPCLAVGFSQSAERIHGNTPLRLAAGAGKALFYLSTVLCLWKTINSQLSGWSLRGSLTYIHYFEHETYYVKETRTKMVIPLIQF